MGSRVDAFRDLHCPVCLRHLGPRAVDGAQHCARCGDCGIDLPLLDLVMPPASVPGYPEAVLAFRPKEGTTLRDFRVHVRTDEAIELVHARGLISFFSKRVRLDGSGLSLRTRWGSQLSYPLNELRGFAPVQRVHWDLDAPGVYSESIVLLPGSVHRLFIVRTFGDAIAFSAAFNTVLSHLRARAPTG